MTVIPPQATVADEGRPPDATDAAVEPLGRSAAVGALWLTGQKWVVRLSGFVTIAMLTRLVAPEDFGVIAAATALAPMILLLADMGLSTYIVQADELDDRRLSTAFWFSAIAGCVLTLGMAAVAPLIAAAFDIQGATAVLRATSLSLLFTILGSAPWALLRRRMQFRLLALQAMIATLIAQVVAVVLAVSGAGVWALVGQALASAAVGTALAWRSTRWIPKLQFSRSEFRAMARFGVSIVGVEAVAASRVAIEAAIISNVLGAAVLGFVSIAQRLVQVAQDAGAAALVQVSIVAFARTRESLERLRSAYLKALRIGYAAVSPVLVVVAVGAPLIVPMIFGPGWESSVPVSRAMAVAAILVVGAMIDHGLHYGVGAPGRWFAYAVGIDLLTVATTFIVAPRGLTWIAVSFIIVALIATIVRWFVVGSLVDLPALSLAKGFCRSMAPVVGSAAVGLGVLAITGDLPRIVALGLLGLAIGSTYLLIVRLMDRGLLEDVLNLLPLPDRMAFLRRLA